MTDKKTPPNVMGWLSGAETALGVAEHLLKTYRPLPAGIVCFHAQQASEKALKAAIVALTNDGDAAPETHDLGDLLDHVKKLTGAAIAAKLYEDGRILTPYATLAPYPNELSRHLDEAKAKDAVETAQGMADWCKAVISERTKTTQNPYKKLGIDFEIPELLERTINEFVIDLNENRGRLADCYEEEIRSLLNCYDLCLTEDQIQLLRDYYQWGGIYDVAGGYRDSVSVNDRRPLPPETGKDETQGQGRGR